MSYSSSNYRETTGLHEQNVKTFILPDECFATKVALSWRYGNKFTIYPRSQTTKRDETITENMLVLIRQEVVLFHPILRQLVNESNGTYLNLQKLIATSKNSDNSMELLKTSRQYRSIVRLCLENLNEAVSKETDGVKHNDLMSYISILIATECIWHLCEILYIDTMPGDVVLPSLLEWVRFHFPCCERTAAQLLEDCERGSESHEQYWKTVIGMIVQGRVEVARALLKLHSLTDTNEFKLVDNALRTMPIYSTYSGLSTGEFTVTWKHWQAETRSKLSSGSLGGQHNLQFILRLVVGDYTAFECVRDKYESWYELLAGWVMFTCPWVRRYGLAESSHACAGMRTSAPPASANQKHLDQILLSLCECDLHQVIHDIQNISDNGWFATHLTDLLVHCGKLQVQDEHQTNVTTRLRDSLVLEYGSLMFDHTSLWSIGLSYLANCGTPGSRRAELLLERLPLTNQGRALKIRGEATKYGLTGVALSVCASMGAAELSAGRSGSALCWGLRARSPTLCGAAAARALTTRDLPTTMLLSVGPSLLLHRTLLFLGKYCEFYQQYKSRRYKSAGKLLVSLISSKIAPDFFWNKLLLDTLPLLESDEIILSASDSYLLMQALELPPTSLGQEETDLLRLALTRNLARAALAGDNDNNTATNKQ